MSTQIFADSLLGELGDHSDFAFAEIDARVGPNAILQTRAALRELCGFTKCEEVFDRAGLGWLSSRDLDEMVHARAVNLLNQAVLDCLEPSIAAMVMRRSGELTADYIMANRIPAAVQKILAIAPRPIAKKLLTKAIQRNAWTFAGASYVTAEKNLITIWQNPICLGRLGYEGCIWHASVFSRLFQMLIDPAIQVREIECFGKGGDACMFAIG